MNCKPGDLAVIVCSAGHGLQRDAGELIIGRIVRVTRLRPPIDLTCIAQLVWEFETPLALTLDGKAYFVYGCGDEVLKPIDAPDEDARDETLNWLTVPTKENA